MPIAVSAPDAYAPSDCAGDVASANSYRAADDYTGSDSWADDSWAVVEASDCAMYGGEAYDVGYVGEASYDYVGWCESDPAVGPGAWTLAE